jgi:hypothetical protein
MKKLLIMIAVLVSMSSAYKCNIPGATEKQKLEYDIITENLNTVKIKLDSVEITKEKQAEVCDDLIIELNKFYLSNEVTMLDKAILIEYMLRTMENRLAKEIDKVSK